MLQFYTLVCPHVEYCVSAWSPYYEKDKALLERIQHRFTRMIPGFKQLPYESRLLRLQLWTLEERRHRADLLEVFKMYSGSTLVSFHQFFTLSQVQLLFTCGHSAKIAKVRCHLDLHHHFFSCRVIDRWNSLPQNVIDSSSVNCFKNALDKIRKTTMGFFED